MPTDVYELYMDLEEKWSHKKLTQRFKERIEDHLRVNPTTRNHMLKNLDKLSAEFQ